MPNKRLGSAASRSIIDVRNGRTRMGAYSLMNSAIATASGTASTIAIVAMISVPSSNPSTPKCPRPGFHTLVVKKFQMPLDLNAGRDLSMRKNERRADDEQAHRRGRGRERAEHPVARRRIELRRAGTSAASIVAMAPSPMLMNPRRGGRSNGRGRVCP